MSIFTEIANARHKVITNLVSLHEHTRVALTNDLSVVSKLASDEKRNEYILFAMNLARSMIQPQEDHPQTIVDDAKRSLDEFCRLNNLDQPIYSDDYPWANHTWPPPMPTKKDHWSNSSLQDDEEEIEGSGRGIQVPELKMLDVTKVQSLVNEMEKIALDAHYTRQRSMRISGRLFGILFELPNDHTLIAGDMVHNINRMSRTAATMATHHAESTDTALGLLQSALQLIQKHEQDEEMYALALALRAVDKYAGESVFLQASSLTGP